MVTVTDLLSVSTMVSDRETTQKCGSLIPIPSTLHSV